MTDRLILIIDNDEISNFITKRVLEQTGFQGEIVTAANCVEGNTRLNEYYVQKKTIPSLILIAVTLTGSKCVKFFSEFKKLYRLNKKIPVVMMGNFSGKDKFKARHRYIDSLVSKPLTVEKINQIKSILLQKYSA